MSKYQPFGLLSFTEQLEYLKKRNSYSLDYIEELKNMKYEDYLKTDHWKTLKAVVLKRFGYKCACCGAEEIPMEIHHIRYINRGMEEIEDLTCLCRECHKEIHDITKQLPPKGTPFKDISQEVIDNINKGLTRFKVVKDYRRHSIGIDRVI